MPVRSVVVVGGGVAAATAALAVARAFAPLGVELRWVDTGATTPPHLALAAPPDVRAFHRLLRVDERALLRRIPATLRVADQFAGWSGEDGAFLHAHGDAGAAFASLPFVQHWTRARQAGLRVALEDFCLAAAAAKHGRVRTDAGTPATQYGYHLDAAAYAALLAREAEAAGVRRVSAASARPEVAGGRVAAVILPDGERVAADLFVDADGALIHALDPAGAEPADAFCDRAILASAPPLAPLPTYARVAAHAAGYVSFLPLRDRTAIRFAYASRHMSDADAAAALPRLAGMRVRQQEPAVVALHRRARAWVGNCVAVGAAAGEPEPLDAAPMLALQLAVGQLVLLWPVRRDAMPEAAIYNAEIAGQRARIDDFTVQHFRLNARAEPFWTEARARAISPELSAKIALFAARGKFAHGNHEAHVEDGWALCMTGHGIVPRSADPQASRVADAELMAEFQRQLRSVAEAVRGMETHAAALARLAAPRSAGS